MNFNYSWVILSFLWMAMTAWVYAEDPLRLKAGPVACDYKKKDLKEEYNEADSVVIQCNESLCTINKDEGITVSAGLVNITQAGTYILRGVLEGQVVIDATEDEHVQLVLEDTSIYSSQGPAIYGAQADKITLTVVGNNTVTDSTSYGDRSKALDLDAALYSKSDLSINGEGTLTVMGRYKDAIHCTKDLKLIHTRIQIPTAMQKGIKARNSLCLKDSDLSINSYDSAIKVTRNDHPDKGYVVIDGGSLKIVTGRDGIHAETHLTIHDGYLDIKDSMEGLEAQMIDILGGEIHIIASNDGINASKMKSLNATATDYGKEGQVYVNIVGGKTYVNVQGDDCDGIDSNGILYIGGEAQVYTSINGGNIYGSKAALEAIGDNSIMKGATLIATATNDDIKIKNGSGTSTEGTNDSHSSSGNGNGGGNIYQPYIYTSVATQSAGTSITVKDSEGQLIASCTPEVGYHKIFVTSPSLVFGKTYTIEVGGEPAQVVFASEGHNGSVDSPSVKMPGEGKASTFEEVVVLDKETDMVNGQVEVDLPEADEEVIKDYAEYIKPSQNQHEKEKEEEEQEGILKEIEDEIDDYFDEKHPETPTTETSSTSPKEDDNDNDDDHQEDPIQEEAIEIEDTKSTGTSSTATTPTIEVNEEVKKADTYDSGNINFEDEDEEIVLPKHFHFDILREGETAGNTAYKWRKEE